MNKRKLSDYNLLDFGNSLVMQGMVFVDPEENPTIVMLPQKAINVTPDVLELTLDEWQVLLKQLDHVEVEGIRDEQKVLLRKSQRNIDSRIAWKVFRRDNYQCRYCAVSNVPLTVDHIITWETGGATHPDNLLASCSKCNRKRGNLDYGSWMQHSWYLEKANKYLTQAQKDANNAIVRNLSKLPTVKVIRKR